MTENSNQPKEYDIVLDGQATVPADGVVLGGLERVKQLLASGGVEQRIDALLDAFQYGQDGLDLVIQALESESEEVQEAAYWLLQDSTEPRARLALQAYNPYLFFECLRIIQAYPDVAYRIGSVAISSKRETLVSCDYYGMVKVWSLHTQQVINTFQLEGVYQWPDTRRFAVAINPDEEILGVVAFKDFAEVWDIKTGRKILRTRHWAETFWSVTVSPDGQTFASSCDDNSFYLWDMQTGELIFCIHIPLAYPRVYFIYSDSQTLVTKHGEETNSSILELWNWQTQQIIRTFKTHSRYNPTVAISPDRRFSISGSRENETIKVWNIQTGHECTLTGHSSSITALAISSDGQTLLIYSEDGIVQVWGVP